MLSTASALLTATEDAILEDEAMLCASFIYNKHNDLSNDELATMLHMYAGIIASHVTDKITKVLLTETQFKELLSTLGELEEMRDNVLEENN